jgi:hypothetical protein
MALDLSIIPGKGIIISGTNGGIFLRNGNGKNFSWETVNNKFYFDRKKGTSESYDYCLVYSELTSYGGTVGAVPGFSTILADILAELKTK